MEQTFVMVKPEGVKRRLVGEIISRFEKKGLYLVASRVMIPDKKLLERHYAEHAKKPFFNALVKHMASGAVVPMVFEGKNAIKVARKIIGATCPFEAECGTIRGDYGACKGLNIVHGSDSAESADREISLWFGLLESIEYFSYDVYYDE
ncbi:NDK [Enterospora canceri]|uniref:Nucleoside diphosphate kinase n=1 Tax=Enterospora canceri TaxID=1081671 RepID=A0A1Y1S996_9MICR|nr:NDK [Enterospora canceri]